MTTTRRGWLPREGFTLDVVQRLVLNTALNPLLTVPLFLLAKYTNQGQGVALDHPSTLRRLKWLMYLGLARWTNGFLNQGAQNNWKGDRYNWDKETILITGGSDGFGKILVHLFAAHNKNTTIISLDIQAPKYDSPSPNFHFIKCDVSSADSIAEVSKQVKETYGHPSVLLLNAGVIRPTTIVNIKDSALEQLFAINVFQHYRLTREFLPDMISKNHGIVVTVASLAGYVTPAGMTDYSASKSAAVTFHEGLTAELRDRYEAPRVRTICVCPNFARTKLADGLINTASFASPTLYPETVAEAIFEKVVSGNGGFVVLPRTQSMFAQTLRSWPWWMQRNLSVSMKHMMEDVDGWKRK